MDKNAVSGMTTTRKKANTIVAAAVARKPGYFVTTRSSTTTKDNDVDMMDEFWPNDKDNKLLVVSRTRKRADHKNNTLFRCRDNGNECKKRCESKHTSSKRGRQQLFGGIKRVHTDDGFDFNTTKCIDGVNKRLDIGSGGDNNDNTFSSKVSTETNPVCPMTREKRSSMAQIIISSQSRYNQSGKLDGALHRPETNQNRRRIIHSSNDDVDIIRAVDESIKWWKPIDHHTQTTTTTARVPLSSMNDDDNYLFTLLLRTGTQHHGPCIGTYIWDFLSLRDLCQLRMVSNGTYLQLAWVEYNGCGDGKGE